MMRLCFKATVAFAAVLMLGAAGGAQAGVTNIDIGINRSYFQTGATTVSSAGGFFSSRAFLGSASDFDGGSTTWPGSMSPQAMTPQPGPILGYSFGDASLSDLNSKFPFGTYTITATNSVTSASQTDSISYAVAADSLSIPQLSAASYTNLQGLNAGAGFTFDFNSFAQNPDASVGFVFLDVFDRSGNRVFGEDFQSPSSTSFFVPANTLMAGQNYRFDLNFDERINGNDGRVPTVIFFDTHTVGGFSTAAVPEPATWSMLILGVAMVGFAARRRSRGTVIAG